MRVISRRALREFWHRHAKAEAPLTAWFNEAQSADWAKPADIRSRYRSADFLAGNRVVFNIGGNKYRLIVRVAYDAKIVYIRFVGTHAEYKRIDVESV